MMMTVFLTDLPGWPFFGLKRAQRLPASWPAAADNAADCGEDETA